MQNQDKVRFQKLLNILAEDKGAKVSEGRMTILWEELKQFPFSEVEAAARELMRSRKYAGFPSLADFISILEGDLEAKAVEAARSAFTSLWVNGESHADNDWDDPVIPMVVEALGGWIEQAREVERVGCLNGSQIQEVVWRRNFETVYRSLARRTGQKVAPKMIGLIPDYEETMRMISGKQQGELAGGDAKVLEE